MWVILWIIQSFMNATWMVLTKKILENKRVWNNIQTLLNRWYHFIIIFIIFSFWFIEYNNSLEIFSLNDFLLLLIATIWLYITYPLRRTAYANEKVSVLQPFAMLFQVFPIIIWFIFIASERANLITFIAALIASLIVILPNIDFKNFKISKYSLMVLISSIIKSFQVFATLYFLTKLNPASFYFLETVIVILISILLILTKRELLEFKLLTKKYLKLIFWTNSVVIVSILLALTMYSTLWIVATSLISLLYLVFVYILWYLILKEIPAKKDIIITILVSICIIIWMWFKVI